MTTIGPRTIATTALSLLLPLTLQAGTTTAEPAPAKQPVATPAPESSLWEISVTPYGWLSSIDADLSVKGYTASTHVGLDEILDHLDMVAMMNVEARRGRWGGWIDGIYLDMSSDAETPGPLPDSLGIGSKTLMLEAALITASGRARAGSSTSTAAPATTARKPTSRSIPAIPASARWPRT